MYNYFGTPIQAFFSLPEIPYIHPYYFAHSPIPAPLKQPVQSTIDMQQQPKRAMTCRKQNRPLNKRNILPNITRKLLSYLCTQNQSRPVLEQHFPHLTQIDIIYFYQYTNMIKSKFTYYIGKENLIQLWKGYKQMGNDQQDKEREYQKIIRILSKRFLDRHAANWILVSKKMKKELKLEHFKVCRKMRQLLFQCLKL